MEQNVDVAPWQNVVGLVMGFMCKCEQMLGSFSM